MVDFLLKKNNRGKVSICCLGNLKEAAFIFLLIFPPERKGWQSFCRGVMEGSERLPGLYLKIIPVLKASLL